MNVPLFVDVVGFASLVGAAVLFAYAVYLWRIGPEASAPPRVREHDANERDDVVVAYHDGRRTTVRELCERPPRVTPESVRLDVYAVVDEYRARRLNRYAELIANGPDRDDVVTLRDGRRMGARDFHARGPELLRQWNEAVYAQVVKEVRERDVRER